MAGFGGTWQQKPPLNFEAILLKYFLPFWLLPHIAFAQAFDLGTLPENYAFVSIEPDARVTMRFVGKEAGVYLFEETSQDAAGIITTAQLRLNSASQTLYWNKEGAEQTFAPHDCAPSLGTCTYRWIDDDGATEMKSETRMFGDIWLSDTFYKAGDEWVFWSRDCTIFDAYGFWVDFVREYANGETREAYREQPTENRIDELWQVCNPPMLTS